MHPLAEENNNVEIDKRLNLRAFQWHKCIAICNDYAQVELEDESALLLMNLPAKLL